MLPGDDPRLALPNGILDLRSPVAEKGRRAGHAENFPIGIARPARASGKVTNEDADDERVNEP